VRSKSTPDIATLQESGVANCAVVSWNALFAPAGTPPEIVNKLNGALQEILADADVKKRLIELGIEARERVRRRKFQPGPNPTSTSGRK
jgi:tripartite-type tricarboxylate transporter receptor subunit TctC